MHRQRFPGDTVAVVALIVRDREGAPAPRLVWRTARVDGRRVNMAEAGAGPPVLFVHGWGLTAQVYGRAAESIARSGYRVLAPDLPGFGGTAGLPADQMSFAGYAGWLAHFIRALELDGPVPLVGHSFGGGVAVMTAHDHPELVSGLVLANAVGGGAWRAPADGRSRHMAERPLWDWGIHFPRDMLPVPMAARVLPRVLGEVIPNVMRNPRAVVSVANLARTADLSAELAALRRRGLPVQVLWSERDHIVTRDCFEATCQALQVEGQVVTGSHSWPFAYPGRFGRTVAAEIGRAHV